LFVIIHLGGDAFLIITKGALELRLHGGLLLLDDLGRLGAAAAHGSRARALVSLLVFASRLCTGGGRAAAASRVKVRLEQHTSVVQAGAGGGS
jgi:hypothetical protein